MLKRYFLLFALAITLSGCAISTTSYLDIPFNNAPSYDGGAQTSGILEAAEDGTGFIVTKHFVDRYDILFKKYSKQLLIPSSAKQGIKKLKPISNYFIDNQNMQYFLLMNKLRKQELSKK